MAILSMFLMVSVSLWMVSRSPADISGFMASSSSSPHRFSLIFCRYSMIAPFSADAGDDHRGVLGLGGLGVDVLDRHGDAAAFQDVNIGRHGDVELVAHSRRGDGGCGAAQGFPIQRNGNGDGTHGAAGRNGD